MTTLDEYQLAALRTVPELELAQLVQNMALGLAGETGEVIERVKKQVYHGHTPDVGGLVGELGDVLWYLAGLCSAYGLTLSDVANANIAKLQARYPDGFSAERSINRDEELDLEYTWLNQAGSL